PYFYQNRFPNAGVSGSGDTRKGVKTDPSDPASPLTAQYAADPGSRTLKKGGVLIREGNNVFIPAVWKELQVIAYSETGYDDRTWTFLPDWNGVSRADVYRMTIRGPELKSADVPLGGNGNSGRTITLSLAPGEGCVIVARK
ncbi:MAG: hypothetical protein LBG76_09685, partial [Treponema sp.]|nr:hypothetical protein [Treponema sp.]